MVRILGICGSARRDAAYTALEAALEAARAVGGVETRLVELGERELHFCVHCNKCLRDGAPRCTVFHDGMDPIYELVYSCDALLVATPVEGGTLSARLAACFNRFRPTWVMLEQDPDFFARKVGAALAVGDGRNGGQENAIQSILGFFHTQGFTICSGGPGVYAGASLWDGGDEETDAYGLERAETLGRKLARTTKRMAGLAE